MMDLRTLTLLVIVFGVVYSHTTSQSDDDNLSKLIGMMTKLQEHVTNLENQQQQLKAKVMDSMANFEVKMMDSMAMQNEKLSNFEVKVDSLVMQNEKTFDFEVKMMESMAMQNEKTSDFEVKMMDSMAMQNGKLSNFEGKMESLQEQYDQIEVHLQVEGNTVTNIYYGCDNSSTMPPTQSPTTTMPPTQPPTTTMPPTQPPTTTMPQTEPPTTTMPPTQPPVIKAQDCTEFYYVGITSNGVYTVYPANSEPLDVYCDMQEDGGWTLIQKRSDDSVNYTKNMEEYGRGFGSVGGEHWLGLNAMNKLTEQGNYTIRFELEDFDGDTAWAEYSNFHVGAATEYILTIDESSYRGTAGDSFSYHNGMSFTTYDMDQDESSYNCATTVNSDGSGYEGGGWWFRYCSECSTTGMPYASDWSIHWYDWKHSSAGLKSVIVKIQRN